MIETIMGQPDHSDVVMLQNLIDALTPCDGAAKTTRGNINSHKCKFTLCCCITETHALTCSFVRLYLRILHFYIHIKVVHVSVFNAQHLEENSMQYWGCAEP